MLYNYFKTAFRNISRNKTNSFLNMLGLSVGIACAALIFLWVEDEFNYDSYNVKKNALYQVYENLPYEGKIYTSAATSGRLAQGMKSEMPGVKNVCRTTWRQKVLFSKG